MTTDPTPLQERIARALDPSSWRLHDSGTFPPEHQASQAVIRRSMDDAAAVLPLVAAEVRKAQADALREVAGGLMDGTWPDGFFPGVAGAARELVARATDIEKEG